MSTESDIDDLLGQRLHAQRVAMGLWVYRFRAIGALGWLLGAYLFDWPTPLAGVAAYVLLAGVLWG